ncbi:hypothetical protein N7476_008839 [Penicillium atrosanguineum]|uniref:Cyclic nucleotide-binding domain-containing protein n=1 Tax=Penicillium atrosanguineum TaxID=1132637 RepID=A0A9W9PV94_9EURO|nr:hypothetical protein N7526_002414 [Penicillium atrosanguineum]KAJ5308183.1 hypothetical protein N7476_008839 [Penicillium atrosanguineum]
MAPDIAIVGGGPCGLALAGMLEQQGIEYIVFERSAENVLPRGGCLDIHRSSGHTLKEAGRLRNSRNMLALGDPSRAQYSSIIFLVLFIHPSNPFHSTLEQVAGQVPMVVCGRCKLIWIQRQGDSNYRMGLLFSGSVDVLADELDVSDEDAVKQILLQDDYFGCRMPEFHHMIQDGAGPIRAWLL